MELMDTALQPNVALMDVGMPVMDGIEAAKKIKDKNQNVEIIMLTSHDNEPDVFASLAAGASGHCLKDVEPDRLAPWLPDLLPADLELLHGPGCPVCVTPLEIIDKAIAIASLPDVIFCSYGDMLPVPGSTRDLLKEARANGVGLISGHRVRS